MDVCGCSGCERCVVICPGLAITLVDYRKDADRPEITIPFEFLRDLINPWSGSYSGRYWRAGTGSDHGQLSQIH